jgi:hypothetical protein
VGTIMDGPTHFDAGRVEAFLWTREDEMLGIRGLPADLEFRLSGWDVSADDLVVAAMASNEPFLWTSENGITNLGLVLGLPTGATSVTAVSNDGSVITGWSLHGDVMSWRWTEQSGFFDLGNWQASYPTRTVVSRFANNELARRRTQPTVRICA